MPFGIFSTKDRDRQRVRVREPVENMAVDKAEVTILPPSIVVAAGLGLYLFMLLFGLTLHAWQPKDSMDSGDCDSYLSTLPYLKFIAFFVSPSLVLLAFGFLCIIIDFRRG